MKVLIIGTNHAGIAAANTLLDNYPGNEIVMIDRNTNLSYLGCGTALWVGRQIDSYEGLFYTCAEAFEKKGAKISLETTVESIDFAKKVVYGTKKNLKRPMTNLYWLPVLFQYHLPLQATI